MYKCFLLLFGGKTARLRILRRLKVHLVGQQLQASDGVHVYIIEQIFYLSSLTANWFAIIIGSEEIS